MDFKINIISDADITGFETAKKGVNDLNASVPEGYAAFEKYKRVLNETGEGALDTLWNENAHNPK